MNYLGILKKISSSENIFKSKNNQRSITFLNNHLDHKIYFYRKIHDNLEKIFFNRSLFDYELYIILMLNKIKLFIVPEIADITDNNNNNNHSCIIYNTNGMISLRDAFKSINFHYLINELLAFLKMIQNSKLLIANLNIDTIYVKNIQKKLEFYIIDFSKANFTDRLSDLDFQSLYISLNENTERIVNQKKLDYFDQEFNNNNN